ncbi:MAG: hypothetical protein JRN66_07085 [Nitrososphaerota archaeon]|nr:hypothetical protein [Nitrososphaerota archaeon]
MVTISRAASPYRGNTPLIDVHDAARRISSLALTIALSLYIVNVLSR